jgi:hypothetical protein
MKCEWITVCEGCDKEVTRVAEGENLNRVGVMFHAWFPPFTCEGCGHHEYEWEMWEASAEQVTA